MKVNTIYCNTKKIHANRNLFRGCKETRMQEKQLEIVPTGQLLGTTMPPDAKQDKITSSVNIFLQY